jgi:hypothetical protein
MKLEPLGELFAKSWAQFRERFSVAVQIYLGPLAMLLIGQLLLSHPSAGAALLGLLISFLASIASVVASIALIATFGKGTDFSESYRIGFSVFWSMVWVSILVTLSVFGGAVIFLIPGIMLAVQLSFATYSLVLEGKRGMQALAQSREYVKGYWWAYVGRNLLLVLMLFAVMLIIVWPLTILFGSIFGTIFYSIVLLAFIPFSIAYHYQIFDNLRRLKPSASEEAAKHTGGFLKASVILGIVGIILGIIFFFVAIAIFGVAIVNEIRNKANMPIDSGAYYSPIDSSTLQMNGDGVSSTFYQ